MFSVISILYATPGIIPDYHTKLTSRIRVIILELNGFGVFPVFPLRLNGALERC